MFDRCQDLSHRRKQPVLGVLLAQHRLFRPVRYIRRAHRRKQAVLGVLLAQHRLFRPAQNPEFMFAC